MQLSKTLRHPPFAAKPPLILEVDLSRGLLSTPPTDPLTALRSRNTPLLADVVAGLRRGARDDAVGGAVLHVCATELGVTQAEELGAAIAAFGAAGKPVVAWTESFGELAPATVGYYLAAHATTIWMQPSGTVGLNGVTVDVTTLRGVLDKIGAEPEFGQRHEYKTAAETFMSREVSEPNREMTGRIAESVLERVTAAVGDARRLSADTVAEAVRTSPLTATRATELGLVDRLGYRADVYAAVRQDLGHDGDVRLQYAHRYARHRASSPREQVLSKRWPQVAVVNVNGTISVGRSGPGGPAAGPTAGSDTVCAALRAVADDEDVKAVVLRVDSPGGSYVASDAIRDEVLRVRDSGRPVVASMSGLAASGGYFVAMPCDRVVTLPGTLTGSIGVLGGKVVFAETAERVGITRETVAAGEHSAMFSTSRPFDHEEWSRVQAWLDAVYADFTTKAANDRGMQVEHLEPLARGRVWTGSDAGSHGLVDELGGLERAVELACERAGLGRERTRVRTVPHLSPLARLLPAESSDSLVAAARGIPVDGRGLLSALTRELGLPTDGVLALPWRLRVT